jgi:hypothetical protein
MIQLFLTLRQARQSIARLTDQLEPTLGLFSEIARKPRPESPSSQLASIVASIVPAAIAAYRAFRQHQQEDTHDPGSLPSMIHDQKMEKDHERQQQP